MPEHRSAGLIGVLVELDAGTISLALAVLGEVCLRAWENGPMSAVISIALWAAVALIISTVLVGIAVAVNRRTRLVDLEKKEVNTTELRRWLNDYEIALGRHLDNRALP